jgi:hypothetical protein
VIDKWQEQEDEIEKSLNLALSKAQTKVLLPCEMKVLDTLQE